jgi:asparagine synthase (glutamine-hydrolysing)
MHPSGRPWIAGCWLPDECFVACAGSHALALFGVHDATIAHVEASLAVARSIAELTTFGSSLRGSFHLVASVGGEVRVQGSLSGLRRVFRGSLGPVHVAASHADVLGRLSGRAWNPSAIVGRMLYPIEPHPLGLLPIWHEVWPVPEDSWLRLGTDGVASVRHWWSPPEPKMSLTEGATLLRNELSKSVNQYVRARSMVSSDLSGGLDSTPICFLAARGSAPVIAFTSEGSSGSDDDKRWADLAANHLPTVRREIVHAGGLPLPYEQAERSCDLALDEPFLGAMNWRRIVYTAQCLVALGSQMHLTGHGGDEVVSAPEMYIYDFIRANFRHGLQRLREHRAQRRWQLVPIAKRLMDRSRYSQSLRSVATCLESSRPDPTAPPSVWGLPEIRLPPWATKHARNAARELVLAHAETARPLGRSRSDHASINMIRESGRANRQVAQIMRNVGLRMAAPLLDNHIVECCLSVCTHERRTPRRYKPLMVEAMQGVVPNGLLERSTKTDFMIDVNRGRRAHIHRLLTLCKESRLEAAGLLHSQILRDACLGMLPHVPHIALWRTLACEAWLRSVEGQRA